jgi:ribonuclease BN (tRNA processing enzyme)
MKLTFLGVGSAFTLPEPQADGQVDLNKCDWQSNMLLTSDDNKHMLVDCGSDIRFALAQNGIMPKDYCSFIDAVYLSHCHADHVGGMEAIAFCTYFSPKKKPIKLFCNERLMHEAWEHSMQGGLASIQGKVVTLTEYFDCHIIPDNKFFAWENYQFTPIQTVHVMAGYIIKHSYGLIIHGPFAPNRTGPLKRIFITTDTQFCPSQINDFYNSSDLIFQDCETSPFKSGVHAHYDDLKTLPANVKKKMWLYHYQPNPKQMQDPSTEPGVKGIPPWIADDFAGFVQKGQTFEF